MDQFALRANFRRGSTDSSIVMTPRALLVALAGVVAAALMACSSPTTPAPPPAPAAPAAAPLAAPPIAPPIAPIAVPTTTTTAQPTTTTTHAKRRTAAECERIANSSSMPNSDLYPYLRRIGCGTALDAAQSSATRAAEREEADQDLENALAACTEQTGMTRDECIADSAAGNAN